jgi:hypothetical protein
MLPLDLSAANIISGEFVRRAKALSPYAEGL